MTARRTLITGAVLLALVAVVLLRTGRDPYEVSFRVPDAGGLRSGSPVVVGGLRVGTVRLRAHRDDVQVFLELDHGHAPVPAGTRAAIIAQNILGQKQVQLTLPSAGGAELPDHGTLAAAQVDQTTDLDQLLATLDDGTRARLTILLNETGSAFLGRRTDVSTMLRDLPPALSDGGRLIDQLGQDNAKLGALVTDSDRYIGTLAGDPKGLAKLVDRLQGTTETVVTRRAALLQTLDAAPATLRTAQGFLGHLQRSAAPLARTARGLQATAPVLRSTLQELEPFREAAKPALDEAVDVAPALVRLAAGATPVLRRATPVLSSLQSLATQQLPAVSDTLNHSTNNLIGTVENWSRAVQFRDRLGHVFRGESAVSPDLLESAITRLTKASTPTADRDRRRPHHAADAAPAPAGGSGGAAPAAPSAPHRPGVLPPLVDRIPGVAPVVGKVTGAVPVPATPVPAPDPTQDLLDFLLGS